MIEKIRRSMERAGVRPSVLTGADVERAWDIAARTGGKTWLLLELFRWPTVFDVNDEGLVSLTPTARAMLGRSICGE